VHAAAWALYKLPASVVVVFLILAAALVVLLVASYENKFLGR
jgi:hypothetical protein